MERMSVSGPARFLSSAVSIPSVVGYLGGETVAKGLGIKDPLAQMPFGIAGKLCSN